MDLKQHLIRQMAFSHATFGPGVRTNGVIDHIRKELREVEASGGSSDEWVDVVILALDGLTRQLAFCNGDRVNPFTVAQIACQMIEGKQSRNEGREWPDWRTHSADNAIEHVRPDPDMLEALRGAKLFLSSIGKRLPQIDAAIAKAELST